MFFLRNLTREMTVGPGLFAKDMREILKEQLFNEMEGSCNGEYYIICILDVSHFSAGKVLAGNAEAMFTLTYRAIVWKPFRGETVSQVFSASVKLTPQIDFQVSKVNSTGIFCDAGPLSVFVSQQVRDANENTLFLTP